MIATLLLPMPMFVSPLWIGWLCSLVAVVAAAICYRRELAQRPRTRTAVVFGIVALTAYVFIGCGDNCACNIWNLWCAI